MRSEHHGSHSVFFSVGKHPKKPDRFPWQGDLRGTVFLLHRESRGEAPRWQEDFKETTVSLVEDFIGDGVLFGREKAE